MAIKPGCLNKYPHCSIVMLLSSEVPQDFLPVKALHWNVRQNVQVHRDSPQHCIFMSTISCFQGQAVFEDDDSHRIIE